MHDVILAHQIDFLTWRNAARMLMQKHVPSSEIHWHVGGEADLTEIEEQRSSPSFNISQEFFMRLQWAIQHKDQGRFALMYQALNAYLHEDAACATLLKPLVDDVQKETLIFRDRFIHDVHHKKATYFYEFDNHILQPHGAFCIQASPSPWTIQSNEGDMKWTGEGLYFLSQDKSKWIQDGILPWKGYPRGHITPTLTQIRQTSSLDFLHARAMDCRACALWEHAQRTVFGEGNPHSPVMFVGEQPGDQEDRQAHPFVGPAGEVFDQALRENHISRQDIYLTNAVKHFRFFYKDGRRLHQKPLPVQVELCRIWLEAEFKLVKPRLIVLMGNTAIESVMHKRIGVLRNRSHIFSLTPHVSALITVHPSYILRQPSQDEKESAYESFKKDLALTTSFLTPRGN